ncbi:hypothetical protein [Celeribacter sp. ULVN23_4]
MRRAVKRIRKKYQLMEEMSERVRRPAAVPLVISVTTIGKRKTLSQVATSLRETGIWHERWSYNHLFSARRLPRASYILTDFDRLHPWQLEVAGRFYDRIKDTGLTAINDPRRFVPRAALLKRLYREGINDFTCWVPAEGEMPDRFPVFLRTIAAHRGVESELLSSPEAAAAALELALRNGRVLSDLVFVEFCAEPVPESGAYRKHACQGIAGRMIRALTVSDSEWVAKHGQIGAASEKDYLADLEEHRVYPYEKIMRKVFDLAGLEFGRIDFSMVGGRPQIYEVNSNPTISWAKEHPSPLRLEADAMVRNAIVDAFAELALSERGGWVDVADLLPRERELRTAMGQP